MHIIQSRRGVLALCAVLLACVAPTLSEAQTCSQCDATQPCGVCAVDFTYKIAPKLASNESNALFNGLLTMRNNDPETVSSWQVTWIFARGQGIHRGQVENALLINPGGPGGQPVRVVNRLSNALIESGASQQFSFVGIVDDAVIENIESIAVNGQPCRQAKRLGDIESTPLDSACAIREYTFCCGREITELSPPPMLSPTIEAQSGPTVIARTANGGTAWLRNGSALSALIVACFVALVFLIEITRHISRCLIADDYKDVTLVNVNVEDIISAAPTKRKTTMLLPGQCFMSKTDDLDGVTIIPADDTARIKAGVYPLRHQLAEEVDLFQGSLAAYVQDIDTSDADESDAVVVDERGVGAVVEIPLAHIKLGQLLGHGAYGAVYAGRWNKRIVAVKKLHAASRMTARDLKTFVREVAVLSTVRHPKVVRMFGACLKPNNICIVEEMMDRGSLHALMHVQKRVLKTHEVLRVALDVALAMKYLHDKSIAHRDLKSHNVLLNAHCAKVADFGIARALEQTTCFASSASKTHASIAGTPAYMAPELFVGDDDSVTTKCDVFSFSVLIWEMLSGQQPWEWLNNHMQIIFTVAIQSQRLPLDRHRAFSRVDWASKSLVDDVLVPAWQTNPSARPDFDDIINVITKCLRHIASTEDVGAL